MIMDLWVAQQAIYGEHMPPVSLLAAEYDCPEDIVSGKDKEA